MKKIKVLYVDDEPNNLNAFKASFRRDFDIKLANSSSEALKVLEESEINIIISDQKMPEISGVEFFESILEKYPDLIRILLTGFSDIEAVINAINKGKVYSYVTKPWNDFDLRQMINNAFNFYQLTKENKVLNSRYQKVFTTTSDLILIFDEEGNVLDYNLAAVGKLNCKNEHIKNIFSDEKEFKSLFSKLTNSHSVLDLECDLVGLDGKILNGLLSAGENSDEKDGLRSYQVIIKDITLRKQSEQETFKKVIQAQETERSRVADDLHDSLGQELSSVKMMIGLLKGGSLAVEKQKEVSEKCHEVLDGSIRELRNICFDLMPSALEKGGFVPALKQLGQTTLLEIEYNIYHSELPLDIEQQVALYRVSQEFISNTIKHSKASKLNFSIKIGEDKKVNVIFRDNGIGFDVNKIDKGRGQSTMVKRIEAFGGKCILKSTIGEGTELLIIFER